MVDVGEVPVGLHDVELSGLIRLLSDEMVRLGYFHSRYAEVYRLRNKLMAYRQKLRSALHGVRV